MQHSNLIHVMKKKSKLYEQYWFLVYSLQHVKWRIEGRCDDIDCNMYEYRDRLKNQTIPRDHVISCLPELKRKRSAIISLLGERRYRTFRYKKCFICKASLDTLDDRHYVAILKKIMLTKHGLRGQGELSLVEMHGSCEKRFQVPDGFRFMGGGSNAKRNH
jgi:hypothetical protein